MVNLSAFGLSALNIPDELKYNMQWGVSTMRVVDPATGRKDKAPRNPKTGELLDVTNPKGWGTFDDAINSGYPAIGMRLTADDPYTVIDLDNSPNREDKDNARRIFDAFDSYTERSQSGNGIHIILKGPSEAGRRKNNVEIYSQERYIICTGVVLKDLPIVEGGKTLKELKKSLDVSDNPDTLPVIEYRDEKESDHQVLAKMFGAANGVEVKRLYETKPSPSEDWSQKDAQLAQHICFYTRNPAQALRIFRESALYRGNGEKRGYENKAKYEEDYLIRRTFGRAWSLEIAREEQRKRDAAVLEQMVRDNLADVPDEGDKNVVDEQLSELGLPPITFPDGLVGEIARYIYKTAPRPVAEVALSGAIALVSGLAGRHYNINGSGLGLYIVLLAKTGRGKEAANSGVSLLMEEVSKTIPASLMFRGPSHIASGQGLIRVMSEGEEDENIPSKFVILSEFGHTLNVICARDATAADMRTRQALLDLFSKNSWGSVIKESAYADRQNNTKEIYSPNLTLLGDTTPEVFFNSVSMDIINEGFLPRFMLIEYDGPRVKSNYDINRVPPTDLVTRVQTLVSQVIAARDMHQCINITMNDEAKKLLDEFDDYCDAKINNDDAIAECWNRAHLQALRLAGNVAVGINMFEPVVDAKTAQWAIDMIKRSVRSLEIRLTVGSYGGSDIQQEFVVRREVQKFFAMTKDEKRKKNVPEKYVENGFLPLRYLREACGSEAVISKTSRGLHATLNNVINTLIAQGDIAEVDPRVVLEMEDTKMFVRMDRLFSKGIAFRTNWKSQLHDMNIEVDEKKPALAQDE